MLSPQFQGMVTATNATTYGWVSCHIGTDQTDVLLEGIEQQTKQAIGNFSDTLRSKGFSVRDLVKVTIFLTDMKNYDLVKKACSLTFGPRVTPACSIIGVTELPKGALIGIEGTAVR